MSNVPSRFARRALTLGVGLPSLLSLPAAFAQGQPAAPQSAVSAAAAASAASGADSQKVVVFGKRLQQPRDVAGSVSAVTASDLAAIGAQSLADYIQRQPGVVFDSYQPGVSQVVMRGIATSAGNVQGQATTGFFLNEVPLTEPGWTIAVPDIDTFDLDRVEVLRGPQGTLFGSASMGGAIQYVANVADSHAFDAAAETTVSKTHNADVAFTGKGMVNVPIQPGVFAVRVVGEYRHDPGYIDNIGTGKDGANTTKQTGGRFSAVLTPSRDTKLTWLSLVQDTDSADNAYEIQGLGDLQRDTAIAEPTDTRVGVHSLRLDQQLGWANLTAIAAHQDKKQGWVFDYTPIESAYNADLQLDLTSPLYIASGGSSRSNSLEVRLASNPGGSVDWLIGAMVFGTDKDLYEKLGASGAAAAFDASPAYGPGTGAVIAPDGSIFNAYYTKVKGTETALFGEATWAFAKQWKLTGGGRLFHTKQDVTSTSVGFSTYPGAPSVSVAKDSETGFNPKLSLAWSDSPDFMAYVLGSEGYRFGTPNVQGLSKYAVPAGSDSDSLRNYELGMRSRWLGGRVTFDATLFTIDWRDIQLRLQTPDFINYATNGGKARSTGVEIAASWRPVDSFEWSTSITVQRARLQQDLTILYVGTAPSGSRLPGSADWSVSNLFTYHFGGAWSPSLSLSQQFLSKGISDLNSAVPGTTASKQGGYNLFDVRYAMNFGNTDVTLWSTNIADRRGITRAVPETNGMGEGIVRPRTFGLTAHWQY